MLYYVCDTYTYYNNSSIDIDLWFIKLSKLDEYKERLLIFALKLFSVLCHTCFILEDRKQIFHLMRYERHIEQQFKIINDFDIVNITDKVFTDSHVYTLDKKCIKLFVVI